MTNNTTTTLRFQRPSRGCAIQVAAGWSSSAALSLLKIMSIVGKIPPYCRNQGTKIDLTHPKFPHLSFPVLPQELVY